MKSFGELVSRLSCRIPFNTATGTQNLIGRLVAAKTFTELAIAAKLRKTSHAEIAQPAEAGERFRPGAASHTQTTHFREGASDQGGLAAVTETKAISKPGGN